MEAPEALPPLWMNRLVELLQPLSVRADRLGATRLFEGLGRPELELIGSLVNETFLERGSRMTVQGSPSPKLWIITEGQALVSADARPVRVVGAGDVIGLASMLLAQPAMETTLALSPIRAFDADATRLAELMNVPQIRVRLSAAAAVKPLKRSARRRS